MRNKQDMIISKRSVQNTMTKKSPLSKTISPNMTFLADHFIRQHENQKKHREQFDQKVSWFLMFESAVLIWFLDKPPIFPGILIVSIILNTIAVFPRSFRVAYRPEHIVDQFWKNEIDIESAQAHMIVQTTEAIKENKELFKVKAICATFGITTFITFLILLVIFAI